MSKVKGSVKARFQWYKGRDSDKSAKLKLDRSREESGIVKM